MSAILHTSHIHLDLHLSGISKEQVRLWLGASKTVEGGSDARFADDGETSGFPIPQQPLKDAAVLVLFMRTEPNGLPHIVFTQRTAHLKDHAGQISFPGGRVEADDADAAATATREAREEIGLDPRDLEVLGTLPEYHTGTGYRIKPVVAWADAGIAFQPDPSEVSGVFTVPAAYVLSPHNQLEESAMYKGRMRQYFSVPYEGHYIWGATAGMLVTFSRVIATAHGLPPPSPRRMAVDSA
jgi:8-oxo-dGTP pyrophosphatase MutT (NUDIX family)